MRIKLILLEIGRKQLEGRGGVMELEAVDKPGDLQVEGKFSAREMRQDIQTASTDITFIFFWSFLPSHFGENCNSYVINKLYHLLFVQILTSL